MGLAGRTLRNTALVVAARALAKIGVFVVIVLLWNHLGDRDYGRFAVMVVYASLAGILSDLGLQTVFVREVSREPALLDRYLGNLLAARLVLSLAAALVLAAALRILSPTLFPFTLGALALLLTTTYSNLLRAAFYARGRLEFEVAAILVEALLLLALTVLAVRRGATWDTFLWVYAASYLFTCVFAYAVIRLGWHVRVPVRFEPVLLKAQLAAGFPLAIGVLIATVFTQLDVVLLQLLTNFRMVGWYSAASKYVDAVAWIPQSAMAAVFPALAMLSVRGRENLAVAYEKSYKMLAILAVPLTVGLGITADSLVHATRGFEASIPALRILALSVGLLFVNNAFVYTLTAMNRQTDFVRLTLLALGVNVALNLALIPPFGYLGASWAVVGTELTLFAGGWLLLRRHLYALPFLRSIGRVLASGLLLAAVVFAIRSQPLPLVVPVAAAVYGASLVLLRALDTSEWSVVRAGLLGR